MCSHSNNIAKTAETREFDTNPQSAEHPGVEADQGKTEFRDHNYRQRASPFYNYASYDDAYEQEQDEDSDYGYDSDYDDCRTKQEQQAYLTGENVIKAAKIVGSVAVVGAGVWLAAPYIAAGAAASWAWAKSKRGKT